MRILTALVLAVSLSGTFAVSRAKAEVIETQKQNVDEETTGERLASEIRVTSANDNFIASGYIPEVNPKRLANFEKLRKKVINYAKLPDGDFVINASAYTAAADECGKSDGITASGRRVAQNRTLACPPAYPFGVKIEIEEMGTYVCEDRGGAIKGNHFDIFMQTKKQAFAFGRRNVIARVVR